MFPALLWQEEASVEQAVKHAALRFRDKFDRGWPNTAKIHPSAFRGSLRDQVEVAGRTVRIIPCTYIQPQQVLIGYREERASV